MEIDGRWPHTQLVLQAWQCADYPTEEAAKEVMRLSRDIRLSTWQPHHFPMTGIEATPCRFRVFLAKAGVDGLFVWGLANCLQDHLPLPCWNLTSEVRISQLKELASRFRPSRHCDGFLARSDTSPELVFKSY